MNMFSTHLATTADPPSRSDVASSSMETGTCLFASLGSNLLNSQVWILNSGGSTHICNSSNAYMTLKSLDGSTETLPNHTIIHVHSYSDIQLSSHTLLRNALYIPDFKFNLFSFRTFTTDSHFTVTFHQDHVFIQETCTKGMISKGKKVGGLYVLDLASSTLQSMAFVNHISATLWNHRLGHIFVISLKKYTWICLWGFIDRGSRALIHPNLCAVFINPSMNLCKALANGMQNFLTP